MSEDDAMDALLRAQFEGPVPDDGFSDATMSLVPPQRRRRHVWPLAVGVAAGAVVCWLSVPPLVRAGWQDLLLGQLSTSALTLLAVTAGLSLLAMAWTIAEADDRRSDQPSPPVW